MINGPLPSNTSQAKPSPTISAEKPSVTSQTSKPTESVSSETSKPILLTIKPEYVQFIATPDYKGGVVIHIFTKQEMPELKMGSKDSVFRVTFVQMNLDRLDPQHLPKV